MYRINQWQKSNVYIKYPLKRTRNKSCAWIWKAMITSCGNLINISFAICISSKAVEFSLCATLYEKNLIHKQNFVLLLSYTYFYLIFGYFQWYHFFCFFNHKSWLTFPSPRTFKFFNPDVVMKFYQISLSNFIIMEIFLMILLSFMESYMKFWKISHSFCLVAEEFE